MFDTATIGAENDLKQATELARRMVLDWGMGEELRHLALGSQKTNVFLGQDIAFRREYSEETASAVDEEIRKILRASYKRARDILSRHRRLLDGLAGTLLDREELAGDEVLALLDELGADEEAFDSAVARCGKPDAVKAPDDHAGQPAGEPIARGGDGHAR